MMRTLILFLVTITAPVHGQNKPKYQGPAKEIPQTAPFYIILPASSVRSVDQCSRSSPKIQKTYDPTLAEVSALEAHLGALANLTAGMPGHPQRIEHPERFNRQYVGVVIAGRHFIYINAFDSPHFASDLNALSIVCDGGANFWGALFDPATNTFSDLQTNGYA